MPLYKRKNPPPPPPPPAPKMPAQKPPMPPQPQPPKLIQEMAEFIQKKVGGATGPAKPMPMAEPPTKKPDHGPIHPPPPLPDHRDVHHHPAPKGTKSCWIKTRFRDIGQMVSECDAGLEKANDLCYPECRRGYKGVKDFCWSKCPREFKSNGAYCMKPNSIGRGWGSQKMCKNCEKFGLLWYPKCPEGYHAEGCCLCTRDCPAGMGDIGQMCAKDNYARPNAHPMVCPAGKEQEGFMCYDSCGRGQTGVHNVCWGSCPRYTEQCGVLCLKHGEVCTAYLASIGKDTLTSALAQQELRGLKRGQMSNDMLEGLQEEVYNNELEENRGRRG